MSTLVNSGSRDKTKSYSKITNLSLQFVNTIISDVSTGPHPVIQTIESSKVGVIRLRLYFIKGHNSDNLNRNAKKEFL